MTTPSLWENRIIEYGEMPADQYLAHELNARRHPGAQRASLRGSLNEIGWIAPVIVSAISGKLLDGHARIEEALSKDDKTPVPFIKVNVTEDEERLILASFDPITNQATYDQEALSELLSNLQTEDAGLQHLLEELAAHNDIDIVKGENVSGDGGDDFDVTPDEAQTRVQFGDLWQCGSHQVLCGDSTNPDDVALLIGNRRIKLLNTDPPYGVSYVAKARDMHRSGYGHSQSAMDLDIQNDELSGEKLIALLSGALGLGITYADEKCAIYVWHPDARRREFTQALDSLDIFIHQIIIWLKPGFVIGRCNYHHRFEPAFHGWVKGARPDFLGERNQSNVWEIQRENDKVHPTQKPIELFSIPMRNHLIKGDVVYEPFAGSGSQVIAAEREGMCCVAMEYEPKYVNVILTRWEAETGQKATLLKRRDAII